MLVDSHCHLNMLDLSPWDGSMDKVIATAQQHGVETFLCVAVDLETLPPVLAIAERYPQVWASAGLHPSNAVAAEPTLADYVRLAQHPKVVALGEMGLDYYYNKTHHAEMQARFRTQIRAAREVNKPIIVHTRDAREDTLTILREEQAAEVGGVMHCFTESLAMAEAAMELGFYISFSGIVTFNKAENVAEVARAVPLSRLLIETDAPYLTPVPFRGKPNAPEYVRFVAQRIAELKGVTVEEVARVTTDNFFQLFKEAKRP